MAPARIPTDRTRLVSTINRTRRRTGRCTVDDVMAAMGLSRGTAWRQLRELVDDGVLESLGRGGYRVKGERIGV